MALDPHEVVLLRDLAGVFGGVVQDCDPGALVLLGHFWSMSYCKFVQCHHGCRVVDVGRHGGCDLVASEGRSGLGNEVE